MIRSQISRRAIGALALVATLALVACTPAASSSSEPTDSATSSASVSPSAAASLPASEAPSASGSAAPSDEPTDSLPPFACTPTVTFPATTDRAQITDIRVGTHDGYDRIVFEFASGIPDVKIEGVLPPIYADPSGLPIDVTGSAFLQLTLHGGTKVTPSGGVSYAGPTNFEPGFDRLLQLIEGGDFEAVSTWYLGLDGGSCIRVLTLSAPSRLVIDIEH